MASNKTEPISKWFVLDPSITGGITLLNSMTTVKFELLLSHIINSKNEALFTDEELKKLRASLKLNEDNMQLLIKTITHIIYRTNKVIIKPTVLRKWLIDDLGVETEKAEVFVKQWSTETKKDVGNFEDRFRLEDFNWEYNLEAENQVCNKEVKRIVRTQFNLVNSVDNSKKAFTIELDENEMLLFHKTLENVQNQLDEINNI